MNIEKLKQAIEIADMLDGYGEMTLCADGRAVIVRSRDAGVLFGEYAGNDGSTVHLKNAVQMWRWKAAQGGTLIDCATYGVVQDFGKYSPGQATLTVFNACALIDCTDIAAASIRNVTAKDFC